MTSARFAEEEEEDTATGGGGGGGGAEDAADVDAVCGEPRFANAR
jgi:hypothetical protein